MDKYRFGPFELDLAAFELRRLGEPVKLERRPFDLLALLVKQANRMVPREEIIAALWPSNVVIDFDTGLNTLVRKVRTALDDSSESPQFVETVPGRGYRFIGAVSTGTDTVAAAVDAPQIALDAIAADSPRRWRPSRRTLVTALGVAAGATLLALFAIDRKPETTRIAVMPFENLTGDENLAYLAAGLAEDTSISLAQIDPKRVRVVGASGRALQETATSTTELGRKLGVDYIVQSSLRVDRSRVRVTPRLIRVADGEQVWSIALDRELTNVLGLQRELSVAIAEQIRMQLSPEIIAAIDRRQTQNPVAYSLYLQGRYQWMQLTPPATRRALEYLRQATAQDPNYALAWAGLAFVAISSLRTVDGNPAEMKPIALAALQHAEQLGPNLAETQYAKGYYSFFGELDDRAAEQAARRAIALDPNNSQAHMLLGAALNAQGQQVEARAAMRRTRELEPMFALTFANSAMVALSAGDPAEALEFAKQAVAINPEFWVGYYYLGVAEERMGDSAAALQAYAEAARYSEGHSLVDRARARLLTKLGRKAEGQTVLAEMSARAAHRYVPAYDFAIVHTLLGNADAAFESLDRSVAARDIELRNLRTDRNLTPLHTDPRFAALLRRCGC